MDSFGYFWKKLALWTIVTVVLLIAFSLALWVVAPGSSWSLGRYALESVETLPQMFATFLPLVGYAAGVATGGRQGRDGSPDSVFVCALTVAGVVLVTLGYLAPWTERALTFDSAAAIRHVSSDALDLHALRAHRDSLFAATLSRGASPYEALEWMDVNRYGYYFHSRIATAALALLTIPLGFFVGRRVRVRRGSWGLVEAWAIGVVLVVTLVVFIVLGNEVSEQRNVSPALTAWLPLFGPAVAVATLWWSERHGLADGR